MNLPKQIPMFTKEQEGVGLVIELDNTIDFINRSVSTHFGSSSLISGFAEV
jgi:hypothetical protein